MSQPEPLFSSFPAVDAQQWKARVLEELKGADYAKIVWKTPDGFTMHPWYNRENAFHPHAVPFDRQSNNWRICELVTVASPEQAAAAAEAALAGGAGAIEFRFSDSGHAAPGNLAAILEPVDLAKVPVYFSGAFGRPSALLESLASMPGFSSNSGAILNDALTPEGVKACDKIVKGRPAAFRTIAVDTGRFHNAGATITQELSLALSASSEYISALTESGMAAADAAAAIEIVMPAGTSHFPELAKLRAFRIMWPQLLSAYGVPAGQCPQPRIFSRSSLLDLSMLDPYTNILRLSTEAVSAILGGCDTLQLSPFDPTGAIQPDLSSRTTRNIHLLLREESGLDRVVDPAAGSWYIETLTGTLCQEAWKRFQEIEAAGGLIKAEASGMVAEMIAPAAEARKQEIRSRKRSLIGVNRYTVAPPAEVEAAALARGEAFESSLSGDGAEFEKLRLHAIRHLAANGAMPKAVLWLHGDSGKSFRVAAFAEDFLRTAGFRVESKQLAIEDGSSRAVLEDDPEIVVLCWTGNEDILLVPKKVGILKELRPEVTVVMASKPTENAEELHRAGLDQFIHLGSDAYSTLLSLQHKTGVL